MIVITPENEQIVIKGMFADKVTNFNPKYRENVTNRRPEENNYSDLVLLRIHYLFLLSEQ